VGLAAMEVTRNKRLFLFGLILTSKFARFPVDDPQPSGSYRKEKYKKCTKLANSVF